MPKATCALASLRASAYSGAAETAAMSTTEAATRENMEGFLLTIATRIRWLQGIWRTVKPASEQGMCQQTRAEILANSRRSSLPRVTKPCRDCPRTWWGCGYNPTEVGLRLMRGTAFFYEDV